ncbi:MAG: PstS family phosphate ABC transporter substrate-binding protein [Candidatus Aminicenantales bacterium]
MKKTIVIMGLCLALLRGLLPAAPARKMIQIKGSDTMVNLVQILAEDYMGKTPGAAIAVLGGGSGTGITGLINQTCDIADHSREWKPKEIDQAWEKGVNPKFFVVAVDGLSIVVNEKNPIDQLTMAQVGALYRGDVKNWKALGDYQTPVSLYGRQSNSGTYVFMQEFVLGNKNYSTDMKEMNGNAQIIEGILQDEGAVGYVGVGYLYDENHQIRKGLKVLRISKEPKGTGYLPTDKAAVDSGNYPIARPLYMATNGKPKADVAQFLNWIVGPEGQAIVEREGFFTIGEGKYKAANDKSFK